MCVKGSKDSMKSGTGIKRKTATEYSIDSVQSQP